MNLLSPITIFPKWERRRLLAWGWLFLYIALNIITAPYVPKFWKFLEKQTSINLTQVMAFLGVGMFILFNYFLINGKRSRPLKMRHLAK